MTKEEKVIGVFFGGRSPEHDVSIITGQLIISGLKKMGKTVMPIYVAKDGRWFIHEKLGSMEFFKQEGYESKLGDIARYTLDLEKSQKKMVFWKRALKHRELTIDLAFPAFHGPHGEDGTIQGLFDFCDIPYVGCGVMASSLTMDKVFTKMMYQEHDIPTTKFVYVTRPEWDHFKENVLATAEELNFPLFVKPARAGSSIGITKVLKKEELEFALDVAFHYDTKVIVEQAVENLADLTVCLIGNHEVKTSEIQESVFDDDFFSYDDKYLVEGGTQLGNAEQKLIIPAEVPKKIEEQVKTLAKRIYTVFDCRGIARVDFLFNRETEEFFANEVNPLPGTLYHHLWKKSGVELSELLSELLRLAKEEWEEKQSVTYSFESDILKHAGGKKMGSKF